MSLNFDDSNNCLAPYVGAEVESFYSCRSRCHVKVKGFRCKVTDKSPFQTPPSFEDTVMVIILWDIRTHRQQLNPSIRPGIIPPGGV